MKRELRDKEMSVVISGEQRAERLLSSMNGEWDCRAGDVVHQTTARRPPPTQTRPAPLAAKQAQGVFRPTAAKEG